MLSDVRPPTTIEDSQLLTSQLDVAFFASNAELSTRQQQGHAHSRTRCTAQAGDGQAVCGAAVYAVAGAQGETLQGCVCKHTSGCQLPL
jgi:hypothetical protein